MWYLPPEAAAAWAAVQSQATSSGTNDALWENWQSRMKDYQSATNSGGLPKLNFWIVISLPGDSYSERVEWHPDLPMLIPTSGSGELTGLAQTKFELDKLIEEDQKNVHLTYKVKVQGQKAWRDLLEFLAQHDMLEKES